MQSVELTGDPDDVSDFRVLQAGREYAVHFTSPSAFEAVLQRYTRDDSAKDAYDGNGELMQFDSASANRKHMIIAAGKYRFRIVSGSGAITAWFEEV